VYDTAFSVDFKADDSPLTEADRKAHNAIVSILDKTGLPILSEEGKSIPYDERKGLDAVLARRSVGRHQGICEAQWRVHSEYRLDRAWRPDSWCDLCARDRCALCWCSWKRAVKVEQFSSRFSPTSIHCLHWEIHCQSNWANIFTVVGSRSHMSEETIHYVERLRQQHGEVDMVSMGSSLKLCLVAEGVADVYPRFAPTMEWDTAAGHGIAAAAGCTVTHSDETTPLRYNKENLLNPWFIVKR
jgi:3'(2'), 5'-bisphosphate nucleotidase